MMREKAAVSFPGFTLLALLLMLIGVTIWGLVSLAQQAALTHTMWPVPATIGLCAAGLFELIALRGLVILNPNEGVVMQFFGRYVGTVREPGLRWTIPLCSRRRVSLRVRNFESAALKVNDLDGNPIEIAAVVVWRVVDTAEAVFQVDDYRNFVQVQAEAALRGLATRFPYDAHDAGQPSLRSHGELVAEQLKRDTQERLAPAGVQVVESRITKLAYAPEIAGAMLQRQQASAIVAARQRIVEGAVGMVELALARLAERQTVELDEERKAAMVSNLLVVLCGERGVTPVVNTGTLYTG
jgi:regulator of protease activity HflC (stomatin/prohibitin superfamily)